MTTHPLAARSATESSSGGHMKSSRQLALGFILQSPFLDAISVLKQLTD